MEFKQIVERFGWEGVERAFFDALGKKERRFSGKTREEIGEDAQAVEEWLWGRVGFFCGVLRFFPFVRMVAVGNSLAFGVVDGESDIDLFIVGARGRLFFVRTLFSFYFQVLGQRRHGDKVAGRFCLSFYVADDALSLEGIELGGGKDVYLYFWVAYLKPVLGVEVFERFRKANEWVWGRGMKKVEVDKGYLLPCSTLASCVRRVLEIILNLGVVWWMEPLLRRWQVKRAGKKSVGLTKPGGVIVNDSMLKFHDRDRRGEVWERVLGRVGG